MFRKGAVMDKRQIALCGPGILLLSWLFALVPVAGCGEPSSAAPQFRAETLDRAAPPTARATAWRRLSTAVPRRERWGLVRRKRRPGIRRDFQNFLTQT